MLFNFIIQLSLLRDVGFSFTGLENWEVVGSVGAEAASTLHKALRRLMLSGVASLSSRTSGDFGVSPAEESSISLVVLRGVLKRALKAGGAGSGLLGEVGWRFLGFEGESNVL